MKSTFILLAFVAAAANGHATDHATLCALLAKTERHFSDQAASMGIGNAFLANMADDCFIPYNLCLSRSEYEAQVMAERAKAGVSLKGGPNPDVKLVWAPSKVEVSEDGTLGYTWGRYDLTSRAKDGKVSTDSGVYLTIWKRQADGSWKFVYDGSPEMPGGPELKAFMDRSAFFKQPAS